LLAWRAEVNRADGNAQTPLFYAARHGQSACAQLLLEARADVTASDVNGQVPLHYAVKHRHPRCTQTLLEVPTKLDARDRLGHTPLFCAVDVECCRLLLQARCKVDSRDKNGQSALFHSVRGGHDKKVQLLLSHRALVNLEDRNKQTPLFMAVHAGHLMVCRLLLENGAGPCHRDRQRKSALQLATVQDNTELVQLLQTSVATWRDGRSASGLATVKEETVKKETVKEEEVKEEAVQEEAVKEEPVQTLVSDGPANPAPTSDCQSPKSPNNRVTSYRKVQDGTRAVRYRQTKKVFDPLFHARAADVHADAASNGKKPVPMVSEPECSEPVQAFAPLVHARNAADSDADAASNGNKCVPTVSEPECQEPVEPVQVFDPLFHARNAADVDVVAASTGKTPAPTESEPECLEPVQVFDPVFHARNAVVDVDADAASNGKKPVPTESEPECLEPMQAKATEALAEATGALSKPMLPSGSIFPDASGELPQAVLGGTPEAIRRLIAEGHNPRVLNDDGLNLVFQATMRPKGQDREALAACRLLVEDERLGAAYVDLQARTPLFYAVDRGLTACAEYLIGVKCDVDHRDVHGQTPIFLAARLQAPACAAMLLQHSANPNHVDLLGRTPLSVAAATGCAAVHGLLLRHARASSSTREGSEAAESSSSASDRGQSMQNCGDLAGGGKRRKYCIVFADPTDPDGGRPIPFQSPAYEDALQRLCDACPGLQWPEGAKLTDGPSRDGSSMSMPTFGDMTL